MENKGLFTRRSILRLGLMAIPLFAVVRNFCVPSKKDDRFVSEYALDLSGMTFLQGHNEDLILSEITSHLVHLNTIGPEWFHQHAIVQARYKNRNLLMSSTRELSLTEKKLTFRNTWRDQQSFLEFFQDSEFYKLDDALTVSGLAPKLEKDDGVFSNSLETYLLLQNKSNQS